MQVYNSKQYTSKLQEHFETWFGKPGKKMKLEYGPQEKLHLDFSVLEIAPNNRHSMFCYCTVGMSVDRLDENKIELVLYSPRPDNSLVELLTVCASYHRNKLPLNIHHTMNIGQPWLSNSKCDYGFISLPYLDGDGLEFFNFAGQDIHCYWLIPITEKERDFKVEHGCEELEDLFESKNIDYLNPDRESLV